MGNAEDMGNTSWMDQNRDIETLFVAICDLNGILRAKRLPREQAKKAFEDDIRMPLSACFVDLWGEDVTASPIIRKSGDADGVCQWTGCQPVKIPWLEKQSAIIPLWMQREDGCFYGGDPRRVLASVVEKFNAHKLRPVVATEMEFYLHDPSGDKPLPPKKLTNGRACSSDSILSLEEMFGFDAFFNELYACCAGQGIKADAATAENGPGQFEINIAHSDDVMKAADDAFYFRQLARGIAKKHGLGATFMAKPYGNRSGNGLHQHFSLLDETGKNVFDDGGEEGSDILKHAIGGLLEALPDQTLLFAPNANSYRRLRTGGLAPAAIGWGYENRTTAIRIPGGSHKARRIEHRVAGGDTNPYLMMAAILSAALHGIERKLLPPAPIEGLAHEHDLPSLPGSWQEALKQFSESALIASQMGEEFQSIYATTKSQEIEVFLSRVTDFEYETLLGTL